MRGMDGRSQASLPGVPLVEGSKTLVTDKQKAEATVKVYAGVSRLKVDREHEKRAYQTVREHLKKEIPVTPYEDEFSKHELFRAVRKLKNGAAGIDEVHPSALKHLPRQAREKLLEIFNRSLLEGRVPAQWRKAIIVPIHKKNKPMDNVRSYRPVSLLSVIAKLMERMVTNRVKSWERDNNIIPECQAGFQPGRSTLDVLASVTQRSFDALQRKERTIIVGVDFRAAFDRVWRRGLLRDLADYEAPQALLRWIRSWLSDRRAAVRWNSERSSFRVFKQGVPQGSPLSPLLFCLATASLPKVISQAPDGVIIDIYADDLTLLFSARSVEKAATQLQPALDAIGKWAKDHYMEVNLDRGKTEAMVVSLDPRETAGKAQPPLFMNGKGIGYNKNPVILGVTLDPQMNFTEHATSAKTKLRKRCNIIAALSGKNWGLKAKDLAHLYKAYVRPGGLYGAGVYYHFLGDTAAAKLESENYQAARCIVGAPRSAPALQTRREAGIPSLRIVAEGEGAMLLDKFKRLHPNHHLSDLAVPKGRPRLKSRGESDFRQDWRTASSSRLSMVPEGADAATTRHTLRNDNDRLDHLEYKKRVSESHFHRRATTGVKLAHSSSRSRDEEVQLHQLRLNRAPWLQSTAHRFGKAVSNTCTLCNLSEEDSEHFITACPAWANERAQCLGWSLSVADLQRNPEGITRFIKQTGRATLPSHQ